MEHIIEDIGLAQRLSQEFGPIPEVVPLTRIRSISLYEFKMDENLLCTQDMDVIKFNGDYKIEKSQHIPIKITPRGRSNPTGCVYKGVGGLDYMQLIEARDIVDYLKLDFTEQSGGIQVLLQADSDFILDHKHCYGLYLRNEINLSSYVGRILYAGAIQPSDFTETGLNIQDAEKVILISIWSRKNKKFSGQFFNGSAPVLRPPEEQAVYDDQLQVYRVDFSMREKIDDWNRAKYFALSCSS